jgi:hypothetical protein
MTGFPHIEKGDEVYNKLHIAREFLDHAMQLYMEKHDLFCAVHLAAAAEELFGTYLRPEDRIQTKAVKAQKAMHALEHGQIPSDKDVLKLLLWSKNTIKHMKELGENDLNIVYDPVKQARHWIEQAIINYNKIFPKTQTMILYEDHRSREMTEELAPYITNKPEGEIDFALPDEDYDETE